MTDLHPLTATIVSDLEGHGYFEEKVAEEAAPLVDAIVREHLTPPPVEVGSGVRFPDMPDTLVSIAGNFITSGNQMQMLLIGTEPVLVVQPEYDAEENEVTLITTTVDLAPAGLVQVLEALLDGTREIVRIQSGERDAEACPVDGKADCAENDHLFAPRD